MSPEPDSPDRPPKPPGRVDPAREEIAHTVNNQLTVLETPVDADVAEELRGIELIFVVEDDMAVPNVVRACLERYGGRSVAGP